MSRDKKTELGFVLDGSGIIFDFLPTRALLATYATELLSYWTRELNCTTSAILLLHILNANYKAPWSEAFTIRALEEASGVPRSTVHRKINKLKHLGIVRVSRGNISMFDENKASLINKHLPESKKIVDKFVRKAHQITVKLEVK